MNRKILIFVVIILGLIYIALAAGFLYQYGEVASVFRSKGISEAEINSFEFTVVLRRFFFTALLFVSFLARLLCFSGRVSFSRSDGQSELGSWQPFSYPSCILLGLSVYSI